MLIDTEGKPGILVPIEESGSESILWCHCFGTAPVLDTKVTRASVTAILEAHNASADFIHTLRRKG